MKTITTAMVLMLMLLLPFGANAQTSQGGLFNTDFYNDQTERQGMLQNRDVVITWTLTNQTFGQDAPLGSGIAILLAAGAGYAVVRRKRSRKNTTLLIALVALLGFTQCKKEEPQEPANNGNAVRITLNVGGNSDDATRVNVNTGTGAVTYENGDKILVASNGHYIGTLNHNGTSFSGTITDPVEGQPLYFYFLGNKIDGSTLSPGASGSTSCTVNISDQTSKLPVISMAPSTESYSSSISAYSAKLLNKCSLIKFNVTTPSNSPICITGMNNKVTIDFTKAANDGENNGFTYSKDGDGIIKMIGGSGSPAEKWAIVLPQPELAAGSAGSIYAQNGTYTTFTGTRPTIHAIEANGYYHEGGDVIAMTVNTPTDYVDLGDVTANTTIATGKTVIGTLAGEYQISIADGATVTLDGVNINGSGTWNSENYAGLTCLSDATIILADGTTNTVKGFNGDYPGIHIPSGSTLTIQGTGSLNASSNGWGAGIGGGYKGANTINCGNIIISGGTVTATGGTWAAGIGSGGNGCSCGTITISSGTVTATGGQYAAGIGSGYNASSCGAITISGGTVEATGGNDGAYGNAGVGIGSSDFSSCGAITIQNTVARVTATKGGSSATNSIGAGNYGTCGTVKFGNATVYSGSAWSPNPMVAGNYGGLTLAITTTTNTNDTWTLTPAPPVPSGAINGLFSVSSTKQVYFSQGNLQYQASTGTWRFAEHQYDFIGGGNFLSESNTEWIDLYRWGTSGINYTGHATLYRPWEWAYYSQFFNPYGSLTTNLYDGAGENAGKADWGYNAISNGGNSQNSGWRTLKNNTTDNEWQYIFNSRTTANEINSTSNARYTQARINIDDWAVRGIILFPDGSIGDTPSGVTWGTINAAASNWTTGTTQCTTAGWAALEAAGCVFLPAAGKYDDSGVSQAEINGYYWSSSYASDDNAYGMYFYSNEVNPQYSDARHYGLSVRLVRNAN